MKSETQTSPFKERWMALRDWVTSRDKDIGKSSMWQNLIKDFEISEISKYEQDFLFKSNAQKGYGVVSKSEEDLIFKIKRKLLALNFFVANRFNIWRDRMFDRNINGLGNHTLALHPTGIYWLHNLGLLPAYTEYCERHGFSRNGNGIKLFYVSSLLSPYAPSGSPCNVLEIGAGLGNLAAIIKERYSVGSYVIVDLPEMLLNSSLTLRALFPDVAVHFIFPGSADADMNQPGFYLCVPEALDRIPRNFFDFALNIDSLQEMAEAQVKTYIDLVQATAKNGGYFINLNRRKTLTAEKFDNNPLMYPYHASNKILRWETDLFMDRTFNYSRVRIDGWMLRIEKIVK